ncbi:MAG: aminotransferase class III-fold pyridoxal phosphate-dependent enzyme [Acidimicrobiaceae bacterium]|nr:aminotransferase class III-fold pyridoxal phosphate-dependent enzyme [Acidimicrobiaceae bacterium]MCO5329673.1 aminotransferase class III-fold pyridoxal phosphate-dependent enzyme [Ilumatobacteraceae bacterium]
MSTVFDAPPPSLPADRVAGFAAATFGVTGEITPLASERDQNLRVGGHVVKVAHAAEDAAVLDLQSAALRHLARTAPHLPLPRLVEPGVVQYDGHLVRAVTWLDGAPYAEVTHTPELRRSLGTFMGRLSAGLAGFGHPAAHRPGFLWNLDDAAAVEPWVADIADEADRAMVAGVFARHRRVVAPRLPALRAAVVHGDANDWNVLVDRDGQRVSGLIDFGDVAWGRQVNELAVTLAYALLDVPDVVAAASDVIAAYCAEFPLTGDELHVLWELVATRLAVSVAVSSHRSREFPDNGYLLVSQAPALRLLRRITAMKPEFLRACARAAAGLPPVPLQPAITAWLDDRDACRPTGPLPFDLRTAARVVVSLAGDAPLTAITDPVASWEWIRAEMTAADAVVALGRYDEDRACYAGEQFTTDAPEPRSVHTGIDLFVEVDTPVRAMLPGTVETVVDNAAAYDYGPTVILRHETATGTPFWVLYGHLSRATLTTVQPGQQVSPGDVVGFVGDHTVNGGWAPHTHLQVMTTLLLERWGEADAAPDGNFEGAGEPSRMQVWRSIVPNADLLLRLAPETWEDRAADTPDVLAARRRADLGPSLSVSYRRPLSIVRGEGVWLHDHTGRSFLDCVNNVAHVGHAHPHVVESIARQAAVLNTNTRYLHRTILDYAERLAALFPDPLSVVFLTNSGSEANELALRIARTATGRTDVVALDWGYHGNTAALVDVSAYKFNRKGGAGRPPHTHLADLPDPYRGAHGADGAAYAASVAAACERAAADGHTGAAAFIAESISGCGGQVAFPDGYLTAAFRAANAAGAITIADEVQVGFGRVGTHLWAFQPQLEGTGLVPDIVTLGKPIGNGHPLGAVITTPALAAAFANGMEWFNTFGGNPVSCAAGMAVLDVIEAEGLTANALDTGAYLTGRLRALAAEHEAVGDVRGPGLYVGVDLVTDRSTKAPATALAADVANHARDHGVLVSTDGPADNVLKIKPPIVFGRDHADLLCDTLHDALTRCATR